MFFRAGGATAGLGAAPSSSATLRAGTPLIGGLWSLRSLVEGARTSAIAAALFTIRFDGDTRFVDNRGDVSTVAVSGHTLAVSATKRLPMNRSGPRLSPNAEDRVYAILSGRTTSSTSAGVLTVAKPGVGRLVFHALPQCSHVGTLSASERALAVKRAKQAARDPGSAGSSSAAWPSNVTRVSAVCTTLGHAMTFLGQLSDETDIQDAVTVELVGTFHAVVSPPRGGKPYVTGNVVIVSVPLAGGPFGGGGIRTEKTPTDLPGSTLIYQR